MGSTICRLYANETPLFTVFATSPRLSNPIDAIRRNKQTDFMWEKQIS